LPYLIDLKLDNLGSIVILIHSGHPLAVLKLANVNCEPTHPLNMLLDLLGIVETFLLY
jgi:hypothetical protein